MDTVFFPVLNESLAIKNINIINSICAGDFELAKKLFSGHGNISTIGDGCCRNI